MSHLKQFLTRCYLMYMLYFYGALDIIPGSDDARGESRQSGPPRGARGGRAAGRGLATSATRGAGAADAGLRARGGGRERPLSRALTTTDSPDRRRAESPPGGLYGVRRTTQEHLCSVALRNTLRCGERRRCRRKRRSLSQLGPPLLPPPLLLSLL